MRRLALALVFALAGCGSSAVPASHAATTDTSAALRSVEGSNRTFSSGRLWVSSGYSALAWDLGGGVPGGPSLELLGVGSNKPTSGTSLVQDMTVAPDGTVYELVGACQAQGACSEDAAYTWQLKIYAPGASGRAPIEQRISGTGRGRSVALSYNYIEVLSSDGTAAAPHGSLTSYRYAAGDDPAPVRKLSLAYAPRYFGLDRNGLTYIGAGSSIFVYRAGSQGQAAAPQRTIHLPGVLEDAFALGPSAEIYVPIHNWAYQNATTIISVYGSSNNGPAPDRSITINLATFGIAVDANRTIYVGTGYTYARSYSLKTGNTVLNYFPAPLFDPTNPPEIPFDGYALAIGPPAAAGSR